MDFKITFYLDERRATKTGKFPLKLRVYSVIEKKAMFFSIGKEFSKDEFDSLTSSKTPKKLHEEKIAIDIINAKANEVAQKLNPFRFEDFKQNFYSKSKDTCNIIEVYQAKIEKLYKDDQIKTAKSYESSLKSICRFINPKNPESISKLHVISITIDWLKKYESYMLSNEKSYSTVGIYLRSLRAIINIILDDNPQFKKYYPFGSGQLYQIPSTKKVKKTLSAEDVKTLYNATSTNTHQQQAKDFWILSYLCNGMNMGDILRLKYKDIDAEQMKLSFYRNKTVNANKQSLSKIEITLNLKVLAIIEKYRNQDSKRDNFLFPILINSDSEEVKIQKIDAFIRKTNQHLKCLAKDLGITTEISTYWARHSFSTIAMNSGASVELISESLGHTDIKTTKAYLDGFDEENKKQLSSIISDFL
ncbi:site-specific integrase [Empedobacter falsenii]